MPIKLTTDEQKLVRYAKKTIVKFNTMRQKNGGIDTLYSFVISDNGKVYDGACFESNMAQATVCAERHAIANMVLGESCRAKIKCIVVADPVPEIQEHGTPPCGMCRHVIWHAGTPKTTVLCLQYIRQKNGWTFPKIEKYTINDLYPFPYEPKEDLWK